MPHDHRLLDPTRLDSRHQPRNDTVKNATLQNAIERLRAHGYQAEAKDGGIVVTGDDWDVFFPASGDSKECGSVPAQVHDLCWWENETTREG